MSNSLAPFVTMALLAGREVVNTGDALVLTALPDLGFEVNNGPVDDPYWQRVVSVQVGCDEDTAEDYDCYGDCIATLTMLRPAEFPDDTGYDDDGMNRWHVTQLQANGMQVRKID